MMTHDVIDVKTHDSQGGKKLKKLNICWLIKILILFKKKRFFLSVPGLIADQF